jgi:cell division protein FtsN
MDDRAPGQQQILLQHEADMRARPQHRLATERYNAVARVIKTGDEVENGALAATRRTDNRDEFPVADRKA